jgi:hypothetical protein
MQKPCHGLIGKCKMQINTNVKLLTKKQKYKEVRNLFPESGIFSPLTGKITMSAVMLRHSKHRAKGPGLTLRVPQGDTPLNCNY